MTYSGDKKGHRVVAGAWPPQNLTPETSFFFFPILCYGAPTVE
jgi:hypothetical protein